MTVGELLKELSDYDPEMELKAENQVGDKFEISHIWQWTPDGELNTHLTIELIEQ